MTAPALAADEGGQITHPLEVAAAKLGCTANWLRVEARARRIPHSKFGHKVRFTDEHLREIAAMKTVRPVGPPQPDNVRQIPPRRRKPA